MENKQPSMLWIKYKNKKTQNKGREKQRGNNFHEPCRAWLNKWKTDYKRMNTEPEREKKKERKRDREEMEETKNMNAESSGRMNRFKIYSFYIYLGFPMKHFKWRLNQTKQAHLKRIISDEEKEMKKRKMCGAYKNNVSLLFLFRDFVLIFSLLLFLPRTMILKVWYKKQEKTLREIFFMNNG